MCTKLNTTRGCGLTFELSLFALVLLISGCVAVASCAAVIHTWTLRARLLEQEYRLDIIEGTLQREVKARAGAERWKKPAKDEELVKELLGKAAAPARPLNWWERPELPRSVDVK